MPTALWARDLSPSAGWPRALHLGGGFGSETTSHGVNWLNSHPGDRGSVSGPPPAHLLAAAGRRSARLRSRRKAAGLWGRREHGGLAPPPGTARRPRRLPRRGRPWRRRSRGSGGGQLLSRGAERAFVNTDPSSGSSAAEAGPQKRAFPPPGFVEGSAGRHPGAAVWPRGSLALTHLCLRRPLPDPRSRHVRRSKPT